MRIRAFHLFIVMTLLVVSSAVDAKVIRPSAEKGENKVTIRADGLACYFCAYGMERFFKKSGRIAWYDMDMKKGVVEVGFIKGKPILSVDTLNQYVHDAGLSPREIQAELVGRLIQAQDGSYRFDVTETTQSFPVETNRVVKDARGLIGQEVTLTGRAKEDPNAPFHLLPERIVPTEPDL